MNRVVDIGKLDTEKNNSNTSNIDKASSYEIVELMNNEDEKVSKAIKDESESISNIIDIAAETLKASGRIVYVGAGNSGRLAMSDACECVPTFGVNKNTVIAILAGGIDSLVTAKEGAEDDEFQGEIELKNVNISKKDLVIGLSASGRTPFVKGALSYGKKIGCKTVAISCSKNAEISGIADIKVEVIVGPEVITGSTRLKAGTAQKMVLNMISTGSMIKIGKVYKNYMVDVSVKNDKLRERGRKILMECTGVTREIADKFLQKANGKVKVGIIMILLNKEYEEAVELLNRTPHLNELI